MENIQEACWDGYKQVGMKELNGKMVPNCVPINEDDIAEDPRIDALREKIVCVEDPQYTKDYHDPEKRSIANAVTITFTDGSSLDEIAIEFPVGHKRRRDEGIPLLVEKYRTNLARIFDASQQEKIAALTLNYEKFSQTPVNEVMDLFVKRLP